MIFFLQNFPNELINNIDNINENFFPSVFSLFEVDITINKRLEVNIENEIVIYECSEALLNVIGEYCNDINNNNYNINEIKELLTQLEPSDYYFLYRFQYLLKKCYEHNCMEDFCLLKFDAFQVIKMYLTK